MFDSVVGIIKNICRWIVMLFFMVGGYVCLTDYGKPVVAILWFWTALFVSPLPIRLRDLMNLKISDRIISGIMWVMVAVSIVALLIGIEAFG